MFECVGMRCREEGVGSQDGGFFILGNEDGKGFLDSCFICWEFICIANWE